MSITYATLDPNTIGSGLTLSNGNLTVTGAGSAWGTAISTVSKSAGKWYWEFRITTAITNNMAGILGSTYGAPLLNSYTGISSIGYAYSSNPFKWNNGLNTSYGSSITTNDVIGVALDMDSGIITLYKNGVSMGTMFSGLSGTFFAAFSPGDTGSVSYTVNFGATAFAQTVPSGFNPGLYTETGTSQFFQLF